MEQTIASYLFFNHECNLPDIGTLKLVTTPAKIDFVHAQINPPAQIIVFAENHDAVEIQELSAVSHQLKNLLETNGTIFLKGIGTFSKDASGNIQFVPVQLNPAFAPYVKTKAFTESKKEDVVIETPVLNQEEIIIPSETTEPIIEAKKEEKKKQRWWLGAAFLAIVAIVLLIAYFSMNSNSSVPFGNATSIEPSSTNTQYRIIK
ncbi:MAG: hypothetical protein WDM71_08080 [Ferruginibacter sp.]